MPATCWRLPRWNTAPGDPYGSGCSADDTPCRRSRRAMSVRRSRVGAPCRPGRPCPCPGPAHVLVLCWAARDGTCTGLVAPAAGGLGGGRVRARRTSCRSDLLTLAVTAAGASGSSEITKMYVAVARCVGGASHPRPHCMAGVCPGDVPARHGSAFPHPGRASGAVDEVSRGGVSGGRWSGEATCGAFG